MCAKYNAQRRSLAVTNDYYVLSEINWFFTSFGLAQIAFYDH